MQAAKSTAIHVMDSAAGAAMRVQLDAMIAVLDPIDRDAADAGDDAATTLIAKLYAAREAASEIEVRPQPVAVVPQYLGVKLTKR